MKEKINYTFSVCTNYKNTYHAIPEKRLALHVKYAPIPH